MAFRRLAALLIGCLGLLLGHASSAQAGCNDLQISGVPTVSVASAFNPFTADVIQAATITIENKAAGDCINAFLAFQHAGANPVMVSGANMLDYGIETTSGSPLTYTGGAPGGNILTFSVSGNSSAVLNFQVRIPTGTGNNTLAIAGDYASSLASPVTVNVFAPTSAIVTSGVVDVSASVTPVCELPIPSATSLDFTAAISQGMPNAGTVLSISFANIRCNGPARLELIGDALRRTEAGSASGFDNFINFRAVANFDGAAADLTTTSAAGDDSDVSTSTSSAATSSGSMDVDINLVPGNTLLAGSYSAVLTVRLTPQP